MECWHRTARECNANVHEADCWTSWAWPDVVDGWTTRPESPVLERGRADLAECRVRSAFERYHIVSPTDQAEAMRKVEARYGITAAQAAVNDASQHTGD